MKPDFETYDAEKENAMKSKLMIIGVVLLVVSAGAVPFVFAGEIRGQVKLPNGNVVANSVVTAASIVNPFGGGTSVSVSATTDSSGNFVLTNLSSGISYTIKAQPPAGTGYENYTNSDSKTVGPLQTQLLLSDPLILLLLNVQGQLSQTDGTTASSKTFSIYDGSGLFLIKTFGTDANGFFKIHLEKGTYSLKELAITFTVTDPNTILTIGKDSQTTGGGSTSSPKQIVGTVTCEGCASPKFDIYADNWGKNVHLHAVVGNDGKYVMETSSGGTYTIRVSTSEPTLIVPVSKQITFSDDISSEVRESNFVVRKTDAYLKGQLADSGGNPSASGYLYATNIADGSYVYRQADASGIFDFPISSGNYEIWFYPNPFFASDASGIVLHSVNIAAGKTKDLGVIRLTRRNGAIRGTIKNSGGLNVANAVITACQTDGTCQSGQSDANGIYEIKVAAGKWLVSPRISDFTEIFGITSREVTVSENETKIVDFDSAKAPITVSGSILDDKGDLLKDIAATAYAHPENSPKTAAQTPVSNGTFTLSLPEGKYYVGLTPKADSGYMMVSEQKISGSDSLSFVLKKFDAVIGGTLKDSEGMPVYGISGYVLATLASDQSVMRQADINPGTGSYQISVAPGKWNMTYKLVSEKYLSSPPESVSILAAPGSNTRDFTLISSGSAVPGQVSYPNGKAAQNIQVWLNGVLEGKAFSNTKFTDADGKFVFYVPSSASDITVGTNVEGLSTTTAGRSKRDEEIPVVNSSQSQPVKKPDNTYPPTNLPLRNSDLSIKGKVLDEAGQPVKAVFVSAYSKDNQRATAETDGSGSYNLKAAKAEKGKTNEWTILAAYTADDKTLYRSDEVRSVISDKDDVFDAADLSLRRIGTLPNGDIREFPVKTGFSLTLADGFRISIPGDAIHVPVSESGESDFVQELRVVIDPKVGGLADDDRNRLVSHGYSIALYRKDNNTAIVKKPDLEAEMTFSYSDEQLKDIGITEDDIKPAYYLKATASWNPVMGFVLDKENKKITLKSDNYLSTSWALVFGIDAIFANNKADLSICAQFQGKKYGFVMNFLSNPHGQEGFFWKVDIATFQELKSDVGYCMYVDDNLNLDVPAKFQGHKYGFTLRYYPNVPDDPSGIYWKMDVGTFKTFW